MSKCRIIQRALSTLQSVESEGKAHGEGELRMEDEGELLK